MTIQAADKRRLRFDGVVYLLFLISGAAGLIYEISWSRQIGLLFGHTVHAAAVTLGAYFGGMAVGYALAARLLPRLTRPLSPTALQSSWSRAGR